MKFWQDWHLSKVRQLIDTHSLRLRLTVGVAAVSVLGLGSVAIWISWKMQHLLVITHKQTIEYVAQRFPHDLEIYSDLVSMPEALQKAVNNLTADHTLLWVESPEGKIIAQSIALQDNRISAPLLSLKNIPPIPKVKKVNSGYWLLCATSLVVGETNLGKVYIAQNITSDQIMFLSLIRNLSLASLLAIGMMTIAIAYYVRRSLQPLQRLSQLTEKISVEQLGEVHIQLENAPSEVKELAQTFDQMLVRLSEAWQHQRQLVSNVSHELRTPLTIVSGYLQSTLRRGENLTLTQREALEIATSEADRTIQLMQDLLDLARADSGYLHYQLHPIILNDFLQEVAEMVKKYSDRQIQFKLPSQKITIKADVNRLKQVLLNLIDNAVKYSPPEAPIQVKLDYQGKIPRIEVCDRGLGIPLSQQARIFERFYRVDEARSRTAGGTGLGLSIVKTLVEGMGGNVSVVSQVSQGSTFTVTFPAIASKKPGLKSPSSQIKVRL